MSLPLNKEYSNILNSELVWDYFIVLIYITTPEIAEYKAKQIRLTDTQWKEQVHKPCSNNIKSISK